MLANIRVAFTHMDEDMLVNLLTTFLWPILEYATSVWNPHLKKHIVKSERIQRVATKIVLGLRELS